VWTKTVEDIITKVKRGRATLDRVTESRDAPLDVPLMDVGDAVRVHQREDLRL